MIPDNYTGKWTWAPGERESLIAKIDRQKNHGLSVGYRVKIISGVVDELLCEGTVIAIYKDSVDVSRKSLRYHIKAVDNIRVEFDEPVRLLSGGVWTNVEMTADHLEEVQ